VADVKGSAQELREFERKERWWDKVNRQTELLTVSKPYSKVWRQRASHLFEAINRKCHTDRDRTALSDWISRSEVT